MFVATLILLSCRPQWPRGPKRTSAAARLLRLWFRIPPEAWMSVSYECCVLSGRGLCDGLITRPEESYRLWCVVCVCVCVCVCDLETSRMRRPWPTGGCGTKKQTNKHSRYPKLLQYADSVNRLLELFGGTSRPYSELNLQMKTDYSCTK